MSASRRKRIQGAISKAKNQLLTPDKYAAAGDRFLHADRGPRLSRLRKEDARRQRRRFRRSAAAGRRWRCKNNAELRAELDARFRFVLIDEYQDTNKAQYQIARGLSIDHPNLCVVGDPDQSIYRWRSADIRNILDFERDFPEARVITLERNYRSTKAILDAANSLIRHNRQRKPKDLVTENADGAAGPRAHLRNGPARGRGRLPADPRGRAARPAALTATLPFSCASTP